MIADRRETLESVHITDYLDYWNLTAEPFAELIADNGNLEGFYPGAQRQQIVDQLLHLSQFYSGVLLVLGDEGSGKTTLQVVCEQQADRGRIVCSIAARDLDDQSQLFRQIADALGLPFHSSAGQLLAAIRSHCQDEDAADLLVLVDDADCLDDPILSGLLSLLQGVDQQYPGLHLVLFGGHGLADRVDNFQMYDVSVQDLSVPALTCDEVGDYLECRLRAAGVWDELPFSVRDIEYIWLASVGLPIKIDELATKLLMERAVEVAEPAARPSGLPLGHMAIVVLLGAALLMGLVYNYGNDKKSDVEVKAGMELPNAAFAPVTSTEAVAGGVVGRVPDGSIAGDVPVVDGSGPVTLASPFAVREEASVSDPRLQQGAVAGAPVSPVTTAVPASSLSSAAPSSTIAQSAVPVPTPDTSVAAAQAITPQVAAQSTPQATRVESVTPSPARPAPAALPAGLTTDEQYLLSQGGSRYTLQVLGVANLKSAKAFVDVQSNRRDLHIFETRRQGQLWFVVVAGSFASKAAASQAVAKLPELQRQAGPWPRTLLSVHTEIKANRKI